MNADDDPEARIRELERPVSVSARPVELTVSSGSIDGRPPGSGNGRILAVVVSVIAAALVIAGSIAVFVAARGFTTSAGHPTVPSGFIPIPSAVPPVVAPTLPPIPNPVVSAEPAPDGNVTLSITGAGENKTLDCAGRYVSISGVSNTVELTGQCAGLTVSGIGNIITVESTSTVTASGLNNRVTYHSGNPEVSTSGLDNVVEAG